MSDLPARMAIRRSQSGRTRELVEAERNPRFPALVRGIISSPQKTHEFTEISFAAGTARPRRFAPQPELQGRSGPGFNLFGRGGWKNGDRLSHLRGSIREWGPSIGKRAGSNPGGPRDAAQSPQKDVIHRGGGDERE